MTDLHALITEMATELDHCQQLLMDDRRQRHPLADRARAVLAESDGPAVPDGREPASVAMQPSDRELLELMPETMRDEFAYAAKVCSEATGGQVKPRIFRVCLNTAALEYARAVLDRWGSPAAAPVPDFGEVAAALKVIDKMQQEWVLLGNDDDGTASPSLSMPISLRRFTVLRDALFRAATLLQQQATPVPVSERLPGPEDCDAEGRCWLGGHQMGSGTRTWLLGYPAWAERFPAVHHFWLPAAALPLPPYEVQL